MTAALERFQNVFHGRICDTAKVWLPNGLALGFIHHIDHQTVINYAVGAVTIAYTLWRWRRDAKKGDRDR